MVKVKQGKVRKVRVSIELDTRVPYRLTPKGEEYLWTQQRRQHLEESESDARWWNDREAAA